jgi:HAD superfamily hydrolase (TIGR01509 family)
VLFDLGPTWETGWHEVFEEMGIELPGAMAEELGACAVEDMQAILRRRLGAHAPVARLIGQAREKVCGHLAGEGVSWREGLDDIMTYLHDCQIPAAVASSSPKAQIEANLARHGIAGYFDVIVSGESLGKSKPDPAIFLEAALLLGTDPRRTIVLEDALTGVEAGWRGGFITIMVPDLTPPDEKARRRATAIVDRLDDVIDLIEEGRLG